MTIRLKLPEHKRRQKYLKGDKNDICKTAMKAVCPLFLTCSLHRKGTLSWKISSTRLLFKEPGGKPFCLKCITQDYTFTSFTDGDSGKVSPMQETHKRLGLDPWIGKIPWRGAWQSTPVFLPGESHEQRSLMGFCPRGLKETEATEHTPMHAQLYFSQLSNS